MPANDRQQYHLLLDTYLPTGVFILAEVVAVASLTVILFSFYLPSIDFGWGFYISNALTIIAFAVIMSEVSYKQLYQINGKRSGLSSDSPRVLRYSRSQRSQEVHAEIED